MTFIVAFCFAILQALQPFIHGHLDIEHPIQHTGFHIGDDHEESVMQSEHVAAEHSFTAHASHTITVATGMKSETDLGLFLDLVGFALIFACTLFLLSSDFVSFLCLNLVPYQSLKRRLPASRAPPQF